MSLSEKITKIIKTTLLVVLGCFFMFVGVMHFVRPEGFVSIVPSFLPFPLALVYISGVFEILGGLGMFIPRFRPLVGLGVVLLLVAVFPANINMAINNLPLNGEHLSPAFLWGRLPIQFVLIGLVWWVTRTPKENTSEPVTA